MKSSEEFAAEFQARGIPTDRPDFYDHPNFVAAERLDSSYLNNYAYYVSVAGFSDSYLKKSEPIISSAARILNKHLVDNGRKGACVDITGILARILEKHGVWCVCVKGSCTIKFPIDAKEEDTYFWSVGEGNFTAAHSWLYAPPFSVVDISIREQEYVGSKKKYLPVIVLQKSANRIQPTVEDIFSPSALNKVREKKIPKERIFEELVPMMREVQEYMPPSSIRSKKGAEMRYFPVAVTAPDEPLEGLRNMSFRGRTPFQLYNKHFKKSLASADS